MSCSIASCITSPISRVIDTLYILVLSYSQPKLKFITSTSWSIAYWIAFFRYSNPNDPSASSAFIGNIFTLFDVVSKTIPPVCVPCPIIISSFVVGFTVEWLSEISFELSVIFIYLSSILSLKVSILSKVKSNPVSITATTISSFDVFAFNFACVSSNPIVYSPQDSNISLPIW